MTSLILVIDSFGFGEQYDSGKYRDQGANTALHICESIAGPKWPNLQKLGLGNAADVAGFSLPGCESVKEPLASIAVMEEASAGKDTTTGHWEMMGIHLEKPFHVFPADYPSFPEILIKDFIELTQCRGILGNKAASGTEIIKELGEEHLRTGYPICYTSADSVFQIACHKKICSIDELYRMCRIARKLCDDFQVGRVIARPFDGDPGHFLRTSERHDFSIALPGKTVLDSLKERGVETIGVGKIGSIFNEQGLTKSYHDTGNPACIERTLNVLKESPGGDRLVFVNLVDTDMIYGHRRDVNGYFNAVSEIDTAIGEILSMLPPGEQLIITADHGCDPTFRGTDHTREQVVLLHYTSGQKSDTWGKKKSFSFLADRLVQDFSICV